MTDHTLAGKVAVVTGAGSGLGQGSTLGLLEAGARTVATDVDETSLQDTARLAAERGLPAPELRRMDVTDAANVDEVFSEIEESFGGIDIVHANAGVGKYMDLEQMPEELIDLIVNVNFKGVLLVAKRAIAPMKRRGGGSIVITSSVQATHSLRGCVAYAGTKAAVIASARTLAVEVGEYGIRVNCVSPGTIDTPMLSRDLSGMNQEEAAEFLSAVNAANTLGWVGRPQDVADAVVFLSSDKAAYITAANLVVDGGFTAVKKF